MTVKRQMAAGAVWMVLARLADRSLGLISTIVLARLLVPADFGLVSMATAVVAVLELLTAFSFDVALVSKSHASQDHYHTAWTLNVIFVATASALVVALAYPAALFYNDRRLIPMIAVLGATLCIQGLENVGIVAFRKEMTFGRDFAFMFGKRFSGFCVTIPLAVMTRSYWALIAGIVTSRLSGVALSYMMHPFRPRFRFVHWRELLSFSKWLLVGNLLTFLNSRSTDFIIGKLVGPAALGVYNVGFEISNLPSSELVAPINRAALPGYAKVAHNLDLLRSNYVDVFTVIAFVTLPAAVGLASVSDLFVATVLGAKWHAAIPVINILSVFGAVIALTNNSYSVFLALHRPRTATILNGARGLMLLPLLVIATKYWGMLGAAWAMLGTILIIAPITFGVLMSYLRLRIRDYTGAIWRPLMASAFMALVVHAIKSRSGSSPVTSATAVELLACVAAGAVTYAIVILALWQLSGRRGPIERMLWERIATFGGKLRRAVS